MSEPLEHDYADAFRAVVARPDDRTPEEWVRAGFEQAPWIVRRVIRFAQGRLLRFRLAPLDEPGHVLGWRVVTSTPEVVRLEARSPLLGGVLVARRTDAHAVVLTTALRFSRPAARPVWRLVGPVHRALAPRLLARAARSGQTTGLGR
ncbi:hypothetical protein [Blastococcus sp. LR1]|uniref:hypothetical protein n=1 Tax=Blastococcus sp. LR1 TaxID=2877000 RepID=UPI001CCDAC72|nr:hypothetical protein [Blastococcus sp. LR1]MCA0145496.1 hypothetical protein [Blastococcus sp. LR1]